MNLSKNIKNLRISKKMTQEEVAQLLGTTSKSVSRWEQGITYPDITLLPLIANIFEVTVDELLGVESIKQDEYVKALKKQGNEYAMNNDYESELLLWQEAYKKFPNNDEIKVNLVSIMNTINIITNKLKYTDEIVKLSENILEKSTDNLIRLKATNYLVQLYSQMDNKEMAELYAKKLPDDLLLFRNIIETRYLENNKLLTSIQINIDDFISEIGRESEFIIYDNRMKTSNEYKKEYLERLIKIEELFFVKDDDYGYHAIPLIFEYIKLARLEIVINNNEELVRSYLLNIIKIIDYVINFKPHMLKSPFMNQIECKSIKGYSSVIDNLKQNILNELTKDEFNEYKSCEEYINLLNKINII